jgi:hypothetical protein
VAPDEREGDSGPFDHAQLAIEQEQLLTTHLGPVSGRPGRSVNRVIADTG